MRIEKMKRGVPGHFLGLAGIALTLCLGSGPALSAAGIDPEADKVLRAMSKYLGGLQAFTMNADIDNEIIDTDGQKLTFTNTSRIVVERPGGLYILRQGEFADTEAFFDGKVLTLFVRTSKAYIQFSSPGTIDDAVRTARFDAGLDASGADFLYADPYQGLVTDLKSGTYVGTTWVHGVECHHLAFRTPKVDWQIWVQVGDSPLPMKYLITTKWTTGVPQYSVSFRDWDTKPKIQPGRFKFTAPEGAKRLESVAVDELGEGLLEAAK